MSVIFKNKGVLLFRKISRKIIVICPIYMLCVRKEKIVGQLHFRP